MESVFPDQLNAPAYPNKKLVKGVVHYGHLVSSIGSKQAKIITDRAGVYSRANTGNLAYQVNVKVQIKWFR